MGFPARTSSAMPFDVVFELNAERAVVPGVCKARRISRFRDTHSRGFCTGATILSIVFSLFFIFPSFPYAAIAAAKFNII